MTTATRPTDRPTDAFHVVSVTSIHTLRQIVEVLDGTPEQARQRLDRTLAGAGEPTDPTDPIGCLLSGLDHALITTLQRRANEIA